MIITAALVLTSCTQDDKKVYTAESFRGKAHHSREYTQHWGLGGEKEAIDFVGSYIYAALSEKAFPEDYKIWGELASFTPLCLNVSDLDSAFTFSNFLGGWQDVSNQIDVTFKNGRTIRFCLSTILFDTSVIHLEYCPENIGNVIAEWQKQCK